MNFLIVDDEYYARMALVKAVLEWDEHSKVIDVEDGSYGIDYLKNQLIDIVLTDIKMADVDGLQLSEYIKNNHPFISIIVISGYADFEYAQKSIAYDVKGYLLKPVNKVELFKLLDTIKEERCRKQENILTLHNLQTKLKELKYIETFNKLICNVGEKISYHSLLGLNKEINNYNIIVIQCNKLIDKNNEEILSEILKSLFNTCFVFKPFIQDNELVCMIFTLNQIKKEKISIKLNVLLDKMSNHYELKYYFGISDSCEINYSVSHCYKQAKKMLNYRLIDHNHYIWYDKKLTTGKTKNLTEDQENILYHYLKSNNINESKKFIKNMFILEKEYYSVSTIKNIYNSIVAIMKRILAQKYQEKEASYLILIEDITYFFSIDDIILYLNKIIDNSISAEIDNKNNFIQDITKFISENYYYNISMEKIAKERYFMNANYFGRMFKKKMGKSFSEFLVDTRMNKAKHLLETSSLSVSEIAGLVGYTSVSYFIKCYKKYYGTTPGNEKILDA